MLAADGHTGLGPLTCSFVIGVDRIFPGRVNAQEGLIVVVFIPVEGEHTRASSLGVATQQVGQDGHQLHDALGPVVLYEGPGCPQ